MCNLSEALVEEGRVEGRKEGRKEGRAEILFSYVQEGIVSFARAAKDAGMSEEEFKAAMKKSGYYVYGVEEMING